MVTAAQAMEAYAEAAVETVPWSKVYVARDLVALSL